MSTHESWQFSFVKEKGADVLMVPGLGSRVPLVVSQSSLNTGSVVDVNQPTTVVSGTHNRIRYGYPNDPIGFTLTGNVKLLKKKKEFPRSAIDSTADIVFSTSLTGDRDKYVDYVDHELEGKQHVWYYTVFYELNRVSDNTLIWAYSSVHGHDRAFVLKNDQSNYGDLLFDYLPVGIRLLDEEEGEDTINKLDQILGKTLDEYKQQLDRFSDTMFDFDNVDAHLIPYIDQLLGWPTNFELSELRRRKETSNAITLWKNKGTALNVEFAAQTLTGWNTEIVEGYNYVLTTYAGEDIHDPNTPPTGWDEATDGVWEDIVNNGAFNGTVNLEDPGSVRIQGRSTDNFRVIAESELVGWRNPYGVLVQLVSEVSDEDPLISDLAKNKLRRLISYLLIHYANAHIQVDDYNLEQIVLSFTESNQDDLRVPDSSALNIVETITTSWNVGSLTTYPNPDPTISLSQNGTWTTGVSNIARLYHAAIG